MCDGPTQSQGGLCCWGDVAQQDIYGPCLVDVCSAGCIRMDPIFMQFIDTVPFQRLRELHQLGLSHYIYPGRGPGRVQAPRCHPPSGPAAQSNEMK